MTLHFLPLFSDLARVISFLLVSVRVVAIVMSCLICVNQPLIRRDTIEVLDDLIERLHAIVLSSAAMVIPRGCGHVGVSG